MPVTINQPETLPHIQLQNHSFKLTAKAAEMSGKVIFNVTVVNHIKPLTIMDQNSATPLAVSWDHHILSGHPLVRYVTLFLSF